MSVGAEVERAMLDVLRERPRNDLLMERRNDCTLEWNQDQQHVLYSIHLQALSYLDTFTFKMLARSVKDKKYTNECAKGKGSFS